MRPMLGITLSDFTPEVAAKMGVPVTEGIRIDGVVDGMGAKIAGLQSSDVIVGAGGQEIKHYSDLPLALQGRRAGDCLEVVFFRGGEKMTVQMELSRRPMPEIPSTLEAFGEAVRQRYTKMEAELDKFFTNVTEEEASYKPAPDEWSAKEVLAHLIRGERGGQLHYEELIGAQESWSDDYSGNLQAAIVATVTAFPTLAELLAELKRLFTESAALLSNLPPAFLERKGSYWRMAYGELEAPYHLFTHLEQMEAAINAARHKA